MSAPSLLLPTGSRPGFERALDTFRRAAVHVPAYADFLARRGVEPANIRTVEDFAALPPMTKPDYLRHYPVNMLLWHGDVGAAGTWSCSSGSTGRPSYWPRDLVAQEEAVELYARVFRDSFQTRQRSTLLVVGFAMGNWIGGTYTYAAATALRQRGHRISTIAPGIEPDTILADIAELGPHYDQVVLAGYPPFVKDVLDRAPAAVLRQNLRVLLAGEAITEEWRDYVLDRIGKPGQPGEIRVVYGTADAGIMGCETATSVAVRRAAAADPALSEALFADAQLQPTFVEYDADYRYTEADAEGRFLFSADTAIPLLRYRINDVGRIFSAADLAAVLDAHGHRMPVRTSTDSCGFLALHRRTDVAASFYALEIYPENVRAALEDPDIGPTVTGKFVLATDADARFEQTLRLRVELRDGVCPAPGFTALLRRKVVEALARTNSEYRRLHRTLGPAAEPEITLHSPGSAGFETGVKHRWTGVRS
ncbi:phenylacetate--CoA ligase family protein [Nocardia implantans]|uniref:Phenylacetate--CoA ligase family protein n=1 Tax=Nocardia implantans TaxID=3108168 RepID=A0ABU6AQ64_9NOCA|nr:MULTISPECIES: phenylacetate--CoA ligase family protein [unclassified Nocardia]MBF6189956.1 phenylacetate--CoA ligase family protein [Nocardia beijingensis]MEA3526811.1 phenylacetate--CoA ligase family protein [Nocardia sp. CDC192]MEB3509612.1 phenylacetate--CoA ligase family protein [Nocardia sp. CDC186]